MKFGTSGLRGLASDLAGAACRSYTDAFVKHLLDEDAIRPGDRVYVGRDLRASSPAIAGDCMAALAAAGFIPVDCGIVPTPALAYRAAGVNAAALMVTGSHIPADRNGIKFFRPEGEIDKSDEAAISARVARQATAASPSPARTVERQNQSCIGAFRRRYVDAFPAGILRGMRIGVYQHSSVARDLLVDVLRELGAQTQPLGRTGHFVAIDTEAVGADTRAQLARWVREFRLDGIVSTDGDGDRPLIVDETGTLLRGDLIGLATAMFLRAGTVVTPVTSNSGISPALGFQVVRTRVGSPYVISAMKEAGLDQGVVVGFEANGGVLLGTPWTDGTLRLAALPTRDSFLPILAVLARAQSAGKTVSALRTGQPMPVCASDRLEDFDARLSAALLSRLEDEAARAAFFRPVGEIVAVDRTDGLRFTLARNEIVHLRASGNAPELRCYAEAAGDQRAQSLVAQVLDLVRSAPVTT